MGQRSREREARDPGGYTPEELQVLAHLRRSTGRTCRNCAWFKPSGNQRGCFPEGIYRKWLSSVEFEAGCDLYSAREKKA